MVRKRKEVDAGQTAGSRASMTIGAIIHSFSSCPSTNDLAKGLAREGSAEGTVVVAEEQTAGRGTKGRSWHSPPGQGLYASVILRPRRSDLSLLPLAAGIGCVEAIREATGLETALEWPNDIIRDGRKLGGILCETDFLGNVVSHSILGIGLNIGQKRGDFPPALRPSATSLRLALGRKVDRSELETALWRGLDRWYAAFTRGRREEIVRAYVSKLVFPVGGVIEIRNEEETLPGVFRGIDLRARLILEKNGKVRTVSPAEIVAIDYNR
ncbi:MAG: biotin--[acetyl-CoA-carboxylase] ligase [Candidatus Aminicenantes bacterium]|nr:biotin--[acetyl-CoA-carboxylase] ligase [Candidatus Aminicenantes bacterium]